MVLMINRRQCSTCIFGPQSPIPESRFEELQKKWAENDCIQQCHQSSVKGGTVGCRGHYEAARRGELPYPIAGVFGPMDMAQSMYAAETLGFVRFVDEEHGCDSKESQS